MKAKKPKLRAFQVVATTTGKATVRVEARDAEEARKRFWAGEEDDKDTLHEWEYETVLSITEEK